MVLELMILKCEAEAEGPTILNVSSLAGLLMEPIDTHSFLVY